MVSRVSADRDARVSRAAAALRGSSADVRSMVYLSSDQLFDIFGLVLSCALHKYIVHSCRKDSNVKPLLLRIALSCVSVFKHPVLQNRFYYVMSNVMVYKSDGAQIWFNEQRVATGDALQR